MTLLTKDNGITVELERITPAAAATYLKKNYEKNRKMREAQVEYLADQIRRNLWVFNGATICFNGGQKLTDGQHRLAACIKANKTIEALIVRGLPDRAFHSIDTGQKRTNADILKIAGEKDTTVLACAARLVLSWEKTQDFGWKYRDRIPFPEIYSLVRRHPGLHDAVHFGQKYALEIRRIGPSFCCAFFYLASVVNHDEAVAFFDHLFHGTDLGKGHPVLALRKILLAQATEKYRRFIPRDMGRMFIKTWNLFAKGERIDSLVVKDTDVLDHLAEPVKTWKIRYQIT